ncbi:hypothetical protein [uncultured Parolsenella sp.]|uniref:hypothetical protein n=1 Tax=uncultured Parolsenella sp. TaxID=2083008 RepID=UPI0025D52F92|nr:hypothetical protein [uncultured Parolsenella sp.]
MSGMQMTGMNEGRGRGSTVGRSGANDGAGATKTCPRCGAVLFSDMNRCYGCLYDFPEQDPEVGLMTPDEPWGDVDEPWGSLDGLWAEDEAAVGGASPSADKRDAALEESVSMPGVAPGVEEGAEGEPRVGASESLGAQSPSGAVAATPFARPVSPRTASPAGATSPASEAPASPAFSASVTPASPAPSHVVVPSVSDAAQKPVAFVRGVPCVRIQTPVSTVVVEVDGSNVTIRQEPLGDGERQSKACG